jgi:hypothetical protein
VLGSPRRPHRHRRRPPPRRQHHHHHQHQHPVHSPLSTPSSSAAPSPIPRREGPCYLTELPTELLTAAIFTHLEICDLQVCEKRLGPIL